ncbi:MAG: hypothetical protein NXI30_19925 [bacterium]|nr:hypothetical protein [bacterium]
MTRLGARTARPRGSLFLSLALMLFAAPGCAPTTGPVSLVEQGFVTLHRVDRADLVAPERIDDLRRVGIRSFPEPELGHMISYRDDSYPDAKIDVYVYPITIHEESTLSAALSIEAQSILDGMDIAARRDRLAYGPPTFRQLSPDGTAESAGVLIERSLVLADSERLRARSFGFVNVKNHLFFKVRITGEFHGDPTADDHIVGLVEALHAQVGVRPGSIAAPDVQVVIYTQAAGSPADACALAAWIVYGAFHRNEILEGRYLDTFEREYAARHGALEAWRQRASSLAAEGTPCGETNFTTADRVDAAGLFREYVRAAFGQPWWTFPPDLDREAFDRWIEAHDDGRDPIRFPAVRIMWKMADG